MVTLEEKGKKQEAILNEGLSVCFKETVSLHVGDILPVLAEQKLHENNHASGAALHSNLFQESSRTQRLGQTPCMILSHIKKNKNKTESVLQLTI